MIYFEIKEVGVIDAGVGFVIDGNRFARTIEDLIPTKGLDERQLRIILNIAMESVVDGEFVDQQGGVVIVREEEKKKCRGNCTCKEDSIGEILESIIPVDTFGIDIKEPKIKAKPSKKSKVIKPVVNDGLAKFQLKHKLID